MRDPYSQQKCSWMKKTPEGEKKHATRKKIYSLSSELGAEADQLVLTRKTSFISVVADLFKKPEIKAKNPEQRREAVKRVMDSASTMTRKNNLVTMTRPDGTVVQMTNQAYDQMIRGEAEKEKIENMPGYNALNRFVSSSSSSSSSSSGSSQINSGKKRKRREETENEKKA